MIVRRGRRKNLEQAARRSSTRRPTTGTRRSWNWATADPVLVLHLPGDEPETTTAKSPAARVYFIRSFDGGTTWERKPHLLQTPYYHETDGRSCAMKDGSVLVAINGRPKTGRPTRPASFVPTDRGGELGAALDGQGRSRPPGSHRRRSCPMAGWVMMARPEGDISWSATKGGRGRRR